MNDSLAVVVRKLINYILDFIAIFQNIINQINSNS